MRGVHGPPYHQRCNLNTQSHPPCPRLPRALLFLETSMSWTEERVDTLKSFWKDGLSASQIAARLGGVTRNAVIGKVHRLGLNGRRTASRREVARAGAVRFPLRCKPRPKSSRQATERTGQLRLRGKGQLHPSQLPPLDSPPAFAITVATLTATSCRWPLGDPKRQDFSFCGRPAPSGHPYCAHHSAIAYAFVKSRSRTSDPGAVSLPAARA